MLHHYYFTGYFWWLGPKCQNIGEFWLVAVSPCSRNSNMYMYIGNLGKIFWKLSRQTTKIVKCIQVYVSHQTFWFYTRILLHLHKSFVISFSERLEGKSTSSSMEESGPHTPQINLQVDRHKGWRYRCSCPTRTFTYLSREFCLVSRVD